jgi:hypothetical protein
VRGTQDRDRPTAAEPEEVGGRHHAFYGWNHAIVSVSPFTIARVMARFLRARFLR